MLVLDCSYVLALFMPDEQRPASVDQVLGERLIAPTLWPMEVANAAAVSVRRRRIDAQAARAVCRAAGQLNVELFAPGRIAAEDWFVFAQAHELSSYDAIYLDLALAHRCALATCDARLVAAARRSGVQVLD